MKTDRYISTNLDDFRFGFWDGEIDKFVPVTDATPEALEKFGVNEAFLSALLMTIDYMAEQARIDLVQGWQRMDVLEKRLERVESRLDARIVIVHEQERRPAGRPRKTAENGETQP